jgi:site-specific DNA-methyltransferase (cytosine-N4-specific)
MSRTTSDLPFGSEFSPSQIELPVLLAPVKENEGDSRALEKAILKRYFSAHAKDREDEAGRTYNRGKLATNCKLGLIGYKVIDRDANYTEFGRGLHELRGDDEKLYSALARHILLNLNGMALVQCIQDMTVAGEVVNLTTLRDGLAERGIRYPSGGKHPSMTRLRLAKAGVFVGGRWQIDEIRLQRVLCAGSTELDVLAHFSVEQRAFLRALANTGIKTPQPANEVAKLAAAIYGVRFPEKSLPKLVLHPLVDAGYITAEKAATGRGAKPFLVAPTKKLDGEIIGPLID